MTENMTVNTKEICPMMVDVLNALINADFDPTNRKGAIAVAALGVALMDEAGLDPKDEGLIDALEMLSHHFLVGLAENQDRKGGCDAEI